MLKCPLCTLENLVFFLKHYPAIYMGPFFREKETHKRFQFCDLNDGLTPWKTAIFFTLLKCPLCTVESLIIQQYI